MATEDRVLLWIDNAQHTWRRVADQEPIRPASGTVTIPDMEGTWLVQWWDTATGTVTGYDHVHADGTLELSIQDLSGDVAAKLVRCRMDCAICLASAIDAR
jgi:hypothetical protein